MDGSLDGKAKGAGCPSADPKMSRRPSWDEYFMSITAIVSTRSPSARLQVGCLLVRENRIVAQGYNGFLPGLPHESVMHEGHEINTVHAEQNAVADCARRGVTCADATAYVTHSPCVHCTKVLLSAGIARICYAVDYRWDVQSKGLCVLAGVPLERHGGDSCHPPPVCPEDSDVAECSPV